MTGPGFRSRPASDSDGSCPIEWCSSSLVTTFAGQGRAGQGCDNWQRDDGIDSGGTVGVGDRGNERDKAHAGHQEAMRADARRLVAELSLDTDQAAEERAHSQLEKEGPFKASQPRSHFLTEA